MTGRKFIAVFVVIFLLALGIYLFTTPSGREIPLTGVVDRNEVIVSPQITGRLVTLTVDEGSQVKKGDLSVVDPFTYTIHALRNLTIKNTGIEGIYSDVLLLSGFSAVMIVSCIALFKRQL